MENRKIIENVLACPVCKSPLFLTDDQKSAYCSGERRHLFDFASAGYLNLYASRASGGDGGECVGARTAFLSKGYYEKISDEVNALLDKYTSDGANVLDAGCGEGYYSCNIAKSGFSVCGFDLSKEAVISASKRARKNGIENTLFGVASVYELPMLDGSADATVNIFAPCVENEYARVLKNGGYLLVAYAGAEHLMGLKQAIYDTTYQNESRADMPLSLTFIGDRRIKYEIELDSTASIMDLFSMTPYYWRTSEADKQKLSSLTELKTTVDVIISIYKKD